MARKTKETGNNSKIPQKGAGCGKYFTMPALLRLTGNF
jgi:hypothetical protein